MMRSCRRPSKRQTGSRRAAAVSTWVTSVGPRLREAYRRRGPGEPAAFRPGFRRSHVAPVGRRRRSCARTQSQRERSPPSAAGAWHPPGTRWRKVPSAPSRRRPAADGASSQHGALYRGLLPRDIHATWFLSPDSVSPCCRASGCRRPKCRPEIFGSSTVNEAARRLSHGDLLSEAAFSHATQGSFTGDCLTWPRSCRSASRCHDANVRSPPRAVREYSPRRRD